MISLTDVCIVVNDLFYFLLSCDHFECSLLHPKLLHMIKSSSISLFAQWPYLKQYIRSKSVIELLGEFVNCKLFHQSNLYCEIKIIWNTEKLKRSFERNTKFNSVNMGWNFEAIISLALFMKRNYRNMQKNFVTELFKEILVVTYLTGPFLNVQGTELRIISVWIKYYEMKFRHFWRVTNMSIFSLCILTIKTTRNNRKDPFCMCIM